MTKTEFSAEQAAFVEATVRLADGLGDEALVLLVGARGAGFTDSWSDLDLWVVGDRKDLSPDQQQEYDATHQVFTDQGDGAAHWTFYDWQDVIRELDAYHPVFTWIACNSIYLSGPRKRHPDGENHRSHPGRCRVLHW